MKISVISPVKNEADFIGFSILSVLNHVHEIIYACAPSDDGTDAVLDHVKAIYAPDKLKVLRRPEFDFDVHDMKDYNHAFHACLAEVTGDVVWFLHPDMIVLNPDALAQLGGPALAWYCDITSLALDGRTRITQGRARHWKHMHRNTLGLTYYGAYGSQNEDFYHTDITGDDYRHHGTNFDRYPYEVANSGVRINHYCECKPYSRRYGKMVSCLETLYPESPAARIAELAAQHPRVNLTAGRSHFGEFRFEQTTDPLPAVFDQYGAEFERILGRPLIR
jgi:glycosyltransferase involved in cell wall biosynthesis